MISSIPRLLLVKNVFCFPLLQELNNAMRWLINIQNVDNECFRWCLVRYLNPVTKNVAKIRNVDRTFAKQFNFKGSLKFLFNKKDYTKLKNKIIFSLIVWLWKQNTIPYLYFKAGFFEKQVNLLLLSNTITYSYYWVLSLFVTIVKFALC